MNENEKWLPLRNWSNVILIIVFNLYIINVQGSVLMHSNDMLYQDEEFLPISPNDLDQVSEQELPTNFQRARKYLGQYKVSEQSDRYITDGLLSSDDNYLSTLYQCIAKGNAEASGLSDRDYYHCKKESEESGLFSVYLYTCPFGTIFDEEVNACSFNRPFHGENEETLHDNTVHGISLNDSLPELKRKKRLAFSDWLPAVSVSGSLLSENNIMLINAGEAENRKIAQLNDLKSMENRLFGMLGKMRNIELSALQNENVNKMKAEIFQNLMTEETAGNQANFIIIQSLVKEGILENWAEKAKDHGFIKQGNVEYNLNFIKVQQSIGKLQEFIQKEITKTNNDIKAGFERITGDIDQIKVRPLVSVLHSLVKTYNQKMNYVESLSLKDKSVEIAKTRGFRHYLESVDLTSEINDTINEKLAIPESSSDVSSVLVLDLLVSSLQIHANILSSVISSNVVLALNALRQNNLDKFNLAMNQVDLSISKAKESLIRENGLIGKVRNVLGEIQNSPHVSGINGLQVLLTKKNNDLNMLETDINKLITNNTILQRPETIKKKLDFRTSSISVPLGPWNSGKTVSYAVQFLSEHGISHIGEWSPPFTIGNKANPSLKLPEVEDGIWRAVYRKFGNEVPECVGLIKDSRENHFRDIGRDILNSAVRADRNAINSLLNDNDFDLNISIEDKMTPLHYAVKAGNLEVIKILVDRGADIHAKALNDEECLHFAALSGKVNVINYLIEKGAKITPTTKILGWSPLHIAVVNGNAEATKALIDKGTSVNIKDNNNMTPLHISVKGKENTIAALLGRQDIDINLEDKNGLTPLHYAVKSFNDMFVKKILDHPKMDKNILNQIKLQPLHLACMTDNAEFISIFTEHGVSLSTPDQDGYTPLHYAAFYGNRKAAIYLLHGQENDSLKSMKNNDGKTPLDSARENSRESVIEILNSDRQRLLEVFEEIKAEEEQFKEFTYETLSNCTDVSNVNKMSEEADNTCVQVLYVDKYVNLVTSMIPMQIYYENSERYSKIFADYDYDLGVAQEHAKLWRNGDSIVKGIRQTFNLARNFEPEFKRKFKINQERVTRIDEKEGELAEMDKIKKEIAKLEQTLEEDKEALDVAVMTGNKVLIDYVRGTVDTKTADIAEKKKQLTTDFTIIKELDELVDFLEFVRRDASKVSERAVATRAKIETFGTYLKQDKSAFERHASIAKTSFQELQNDTIAKNNELAKLQQKEEELQANIKKAKNTYDENIKRMEDGHARLRQMRRDLLDKMKSNRGLRIAGAILKPFIIGNVLLEVADQSERELSTALQNEISNVNEESVTIQMQIEFSRKEIQQLREDIANNSVNSDSVRGLMNTFISVDGDLTVLQDNVKRLLEAIDKAIQGVNVMKDMFDTITQKLENMIEFAKEAKTEAEKRNAKFIIYEGLSKLECNWKDAYIKIVDINQCTKVFKLLA